MARGSSQAKEWSLDPTQQILKSLGNPERHFPSIHVGGTNGKGSVCALLDSALTAAGFRVGRYTSPHLVDLRERMIVAGRPIPESSLAVWVERVLPVAERTDASLFEATTAIAFADFAARGVDVAVVEVGLGGRLDSTNVLKPLASVVTQIGRDHTEYLGDTLELIAREKAGIAKPGTPFIVGEEDPRIADVLAQEAKKRKAIVRRLAAGVRYGGPVGLAGPHQARNAAIAQATLESLPDALRPSEGAVRKGFAAAQLPGRFDRRGRWIFDVAHNPAGVDVLLSALSAARPSRPLHALVGILADKEWASMVRRLAAAVDRLWVTDPPSVPPERRWDLQAVRRSGGEAVVVEPDFDRALVDVQGGARTVLVTGSFHTVGDAMARLPGFAPLG